MCVGGILDLAKLTIKYCMESDDTPVENLADHRQRHSLEQGETQSQHPGHDYLDCRAGMDQETDGCELEVVLVVLINFKLKRSCPFDE